MGDLTYYPFDGRPARYWSSQIFGEWPKLLRDLAGEDGDTDRFQLVEMFDADENQIEVVTFDGVPVGILDDASISEGDLARFETSEQIELREGAEDAARELHDDAARELRAAE